ncbi:MAG: hypothetical protein KDC69_11955, partial [Flavobacteriaceae bacterium]|nr:hypothetical protein [Flavobacteriaceae bacterium]
TVSGLLQDAVSIVNKDKQNTNRDFPDLIDGMARDFRNIIGYFFWLYKVTGLAANMVNIWLFSLRPK